MAQAGASRARLAAGLVSLMLAAGSGPALAAPAGPSKDGLIRATEVLSAYASRTPTGHAPPAAMQAAANDFIGQAQGMTARLGVPDQPLDTPADFNAVCMPVARLMVSYQMNHPQSDEVVLSAMLFNMHCVSVWLAASDRHAPPADQRETAQSYAAMAKEAGAAASNTLMGPVAAAIRGKDSLTRARALGQLAKDWDGLMLPLTANEKTRLGFRLVEQAKTAPADAKDGLLQLAMRVTQAPCGSLCAARPALAEPAASPAPVLPTPAASVTGSAAPLADALFDLSTGVCFPIATGVTPPPAPGAPAEQLIAFVNKIGLSFGIEKAQLTALGPLGQTLVSSATMGSRTLADGNLIVSFGGTLPGCTVLLLSDAPVDVNAVDARLRSGGWTSSPAILPYPAPVERRMFLRRDARGEPYLMNLLAISEPATKVRLMTTTVHIPAGVSLPAGF